MEALIVAASSGTQNAVAEVVRYTGKFNIVTAASGTAARRIAAERLFDMVIVCSGLPDERGTGTATAIAERHEGGVIYIEQAADYEETTSALEDAGIIVIGKPLSKGTLYNAVKMVYAANVRIEALRHENRDLVKRLEETRLVNRAKLMLIETLGYSESEAHRYIEKKAMDQRRPRAAVAMDILKTYVR